MKYSRLGKKAFPANRLLTSRDAYKAFRHLSRLPREHLVALLLDGQNRVVGYETVSIGDNHASLATPACIYQSAVMTNAASLILIHSHVSGIARPSAEDNRVTRQVAQAGRLLGIKLLDHLIIGENAYYSYADEKQLDTS